MIITLVCNQAVGEKNRPPGASRAGLIPWCSYKSCNEWGDATGCRWDQKRGSGMRRVWPLMDCVIIQPWRCRSLERNGLLCLLLLCQCNHSESSCYKSLAQHSWCWNSRTGWDEAGVRKHVELTRCSGLRAASGLLGISDSLILWAGWIINNQQLCVCVCAGVYTCWGYFMSVLQTERFSP